MGCTNPIFHIRIGFDTVIFARSGIDQTGPVQIRYGAYSFPYNVQIFPLLNLICRQTFVDLHKQTLSAWSLWLFLNCRR